MTRRNIGNMLIQSFSLFLVCITVVSPSIILSPGLQRKTQGETCTFQWVVQASFASYSVYNKTTSQQTALSANANHTRDNAKGIISLTIWNVKLWDAGNYSLSINMGTSTTTDSGALLFVYGNSQSFLNQTGGSIPATEGSTVEITCTVTPSSLPASYRPKIYYFWGVGGIPRLRNISSGPATLPNGDTLTGYSIKNDGRTLVIDSVQYSDRQIKCWGQEEGSTYVCCSAPFDLQLNYRPHILSPTPPSRRFHTDVGNQVQFSFTVNTNPALSSWNWIFVSTSGIQTSLPTAALQTASTLSFSITEQTYYGNYSITLANIVGSAVETFQVLPPAPPDTPSNLKVGYATHRQISLQWNCMWFNGREQTVSVLLIEITSNTEVETRNTTVSTSCYNSTRSTLFQSNIRPETSYKASAWSNNALGSSDVITLAVKTPKRFKFVVSSKTITISGTQATIDFSTLNGNVTYLSVTCCVESSGDCRSYSYDIINATYRVVYDNLPDSDVYFFDFKVYGGEEDKYYLTMVGGIRASRTGDDGDWNTTHLLSSVVALAVLLGISVLALVGSLSFLLIKRQHSPSPPKSFPKSTPKSPPTTEEKKPRDLPKRPLPKQRTTLPVVQAPPPDEDQEETYELADAPKSPDDNFYMPLNEKQPNRAQKNQYS